MRDGCGIKLGMRASLILKINFLLLGLGLTVYFSYLIRNQGVNPELLALFGIQSPIAIHKSADTAGAVASASPGGEQSSRGLQLPAQTGAAEADAPANKFKWTWCDTRVTAMIKPSEFKIAQEGNLWVYETAVRQVVNFLSVEKWLANFCTVEAKKVNDLPKVADEEFQPELVVKFVDGHVEILRKSADGRYLWRDQVFTSEEFDGALAELTQLPKAQIIKSK
jgi:hypothetical protein